MNSFCPDLTAIFFRRTLVSYEINLIRIDEKNFLIEPFISIPAVLNSVPFGSITFNSPIYVLYFRLNLRNVSFTE